MSSRRTTDDSSAGDDTSILRHDDHGAVTIRTAPKNPSLLDQMISGLTGKSMNAQGSYDEDDLDTKLDTVVRAVGNLMFPHTDSMESAEESDEECSVMGATSLQSHNEEDDGTFSTRSHGSEDDITFGSLLSAILTVPSDRSDSEFGADLTEAASIISEFTFFVSPLNVDANGDSTVCDERATLRNIGEVNAEPGKLKIVNRTPSRFDKYESKKTGEKVDKPPLKKTPSKSFSVSRENYEPETENVGKEVGLDEMLQQISVQARTPSSGSDYQGVVLFDSSSIKGIAAQSKSSNAGKSTENIEIMEDVDQGQEYGVDEIEAFNSLLSDHIEPSEIGEEVELCKELKVLGTNGPGGSNRTDLKGVLVNETGAKKYDTSRVRLVSKLLMLAYGDYVTKDQSEAKAIALLERLEGRENTLLDVLKEAASKASKKERQGIFHGFKRAKKASKYFVRATAYTTTDVFDKHSEFSTSTSDLSSNITEMPLSPDDTISTADLSSD